MLRRHTITWPGGELSLDRCRVMGILNVTPDSFSDGGQYRGVTQAVARAWEIAQEGADILDIGAESTRPGAEPVTLSDERERVVPILERLAKENYPLPISLDSAKPALVEEVLDRKLGQIVNDVEGLRNREMQQLIKKKKAPVILMHMFGTPRSMQKDFHYDCVVQDLIAFFQKRLREVDLQQNVILDPGIGFGKGVMHNLEILARLPEFQELGFPLLIGASRKSFIGQVLDAPVEDRLEGSLAAASVAAYHGVQIVRVHDVRATVKAVRLAEAIREQNAA